MLEGRLPPGKVGTCGYHGCGDIVMHFGSKAQKYYAKCCAEYVMLFFKDFYVGLCCHVCRFSENHKMFIYVEDYLKLKSRVGVEEEV